jgi:sigma-B regulation protein RsbU (phosphoserine phosphatase)
VLYSNLNEFFHLPVYAYMEPLTFAGFILTLGYLAAQKVFTDERRLLLIEDELAVAREIQNSTLPTGVPQLAALRIHAAYHPMTAVGGDFYEFIPVDSYRVGFLVADVSGHGVPAALISSMIKVATQSVLSCAHDPAEVLLRLNRILSSQLRGQLISAAYLFIDTSARTARYSAAGHPPLLRWHNNQLEHIESNGLLFGVIPDCTFPVCELPIGSHDRFLLYTDGVIEPENAAGESFGDRQLEAVVRASQSLSPSELSTQLLAKLQSRQGFPLALQDDITLIVIDVV